ncbi:MAG: hypothetical protein H6Q25_810 [Bacteroidetes bacterium]|nr:hypothetical protein [Bacteroidota bacterium]
MIKRLKEFQVHELLNLPESGMGFQLIEASLSGYGFSHKYLVLNSQIIIEDNPQIFLEIKSFFQSGYQAMSALPEVEFKNINLVENLTNYRIKSYSMNNGTGAIHQPIIHANGIELFTRLSAFENDRRIDFINKKILPGSFATTNDDFIFCKKNNINPIDRYALPNNEEIKWAFHFRPKNTDTLQKGIVEPAYNHNGGGVEAYFANGTSKDTLFGKYPY